MHNWLRENHDWYDNWHKKTYSSVVHMLVLLLTVTISGFSLHQNQPITKADGNTYYVDTTRGTDQAGCGSGTNTDACKTIQYTITNIAGANDILSLATGTYDESIDLDSELIIDGNDVATITDTSGDGSTGQLISIDDGQTAAGTIIRNITLLGGASTPGSGISSSGSGFTIKDSTIRGFQVDGLSLGDDASYTVSNNTFTSNERAIYNALSSTTLIDSNTFTSNTENLFQMTAPDGLTVVNNVFNGGGLEVIAGNSQVGTVVFANNTLYNSEGLKLTDTVSGSGTLRAYIKNNIFSIGSYDYALELTETGDSITFASDNNLFNLGGSVNLAISGGTRYAALSNWQGHSSSPDANSLEADPLFTTAGSDFTLQNTSRAIGAGTATIVSGSDLSTYSLTRDYSDNTRPLAGTLVDIGAYENTSMGELTSIAVTVGDRTLDSIDPASQLTATGSYNVGSNQDLTSLATWASSDTTKVVVSPTHIARGMGTGSSEITASYNGVTSSALAFTTSRLDDYFSLYFDASGGNDSTGIGTETAPYKTLTKLTELSGGARAYLKGNFTANVTLTSAVSGTSSQNTWITNWPDESPRINAGGGMNAILLSSADYVTINGLFLYGATNALSGAGIGLLTSDNVTLSNNTITANLYGIGNSSSGGGDDHTYSNNKIYANTRGGIILGGNNDAIIANNVVYENNGSGVQSGLVFIGTLADVDVWNNTIVNHAGGAIRLDNTGSGDPTVTVLTAKNNILVQTTSGYEEPVRMASGIPGATRNMLDYNLYYTENSIGLFEVGGTATADLDSWKATYPTFDLRSISSSPGFTDMSSDDYTITNSSNAVNKGTPSTDSEIPTVAQSDILAFNRNSRYDMGAYETDVSSGGSSRPSRRTTDSGSSGSSRTESSTESSTDTASDTRSEEVEVERATERRTIVDPEEVISEELPAADFNTRTIRVQVTLGSNKNQQLVNKVNQLLEGDLSIQNASTVQQKLENALGQSTINSIADLNGNETIKNRLLSLPELKGLLKGQSSKNLILEIWTPGDRETPLATLALGTNIFGEVTIETPEFLSESNRYDFTIKKPFGIRQSINNQRIFKEMTLNFTSAGALVGGDLNGDGVVDFNDFQSLITDFTQIKENPTNYDFDGDGNFGLSDFSELVKGLIGN